jgi:hypothetical protein
MKMTFNSFTFYSLMVVSLIVMTANDGRVRAEPPAIKIRLNFEAGKFDRSGKPFYPFGEPVRASYEVRNESSREIWISKGFLLKKFFLEMKIIDPAGRLLIAKSDELHDEFPNAPPIPYVLHQGRLISASPCEVLKPGKLVSQGVDDLGKYYPMVLPGQYSAQIQVSPMIFKESPCNIHDYHWLGTIKSEMRYFYTEGRTKVSIVPDQWNLAWQRDTKPSPVKVYIDPEEGRSVEDYKKDSIFLNTVSARGIEKAGARIIAFYDAKECLATLGQVETNQEYPVVITGRLKNNQPYGGGRMVRIVGENNIPPAKPRIRYRP